MLGQRKLVALNGARQAAIHQHAPAIGTRRSLCNGFELNCHGE
jgi:hypothetical protein